MTKQKQKKNRMVGLHGGTFLFYLKWPNLLENKYEYEENSNQKHERFYSGQ